MSQPLDIYEPVDSHRRQIRVLHLDPGQYDDVLVCKTQSLLLEDSPSRPYTALSYVWGDKFITTSIRFNNAQDFQITANLAAALRHLRSDTEVQTLWTDALCINQQDGSEKTLQVQLMRDIYQSANETCLWLGVQAEDSDLAMDAIGGLHCGDAEIPERWFEDGGKIMQAVGRLQQRPWWTRVWIIQGESILSGLACPAQLNQIVETLLSPRPYFRCGNKTVPVEAFVYLDDLRRHWHRPEQRYISLPGHSERNNLIQKNPFSAVLTDYLEDRANVATNKAALADLLIATDDFRATDPRDNIYALLGISKPGDRATIVPDYEKPILDLYCFVVAQFIVAYQSLIWLQFDQDNKSTEHRLPSWVRDFSSSGDTELRPSYISFILGHYWASGKNVWGREKVYINSLFPNGYQQLYTRGFVVDRVALINCNERDQIYVGIDPAERLNSIKARLRSTLVNVKMWESQVAQHSRTPYAHGRKQAFWRTLMANRTADWAQLSADESRNEYFETWLGRSVVPPEFEETHPDIPPEEMSRVYVKPFTDACVPRCYGRSFILTEKGYMGLAPLKTQVGDVVAILQGGNVPFVLTNSTSGQEGTEQAEHWELVGEAYVHGIMEGEAVYAAQETDVRTFVLV